MGLCLSSPEKKAQKYMPKGHQYALPAQPAAGKRTSSSSGKPAAASPASGSSKVPPGPPDFGLSPVYDVIKLLGQGGEGETWLCKEVATGQKFACKLIKRPIPKPALQVIKREIKIQADLGQGHLGIVGADEVVLTKTHLGLVMEYISGGNMVQFVTKRRESKNERNGMCLEEEEARYYFQQLISAVEYCHKHHVAHRDLKLDNTLLDAHNPPRLKLCDFGFAKSWNLTSNMDTMRIGTPEYMGPELISSRTGYDGKKVDVWASGVLLYVMLMGMFPFEGQDENFGNTAGLYDIFMQQIKTPWREQPNNVNAGSRLSPELKDLLDKMFDVKQDTRIGIEAIKSHPWFQKVLQPKYQQSLEDLAVQQLNVDAARATESTAYVAERDKALEVLLERATTAALPTEVMGRVNLSKVRRSAAAAPAVTGVNMSILPEE